MTDPAYFELCCDGEVDLAAYGALLYALFLEEIAEGGFKEPGPWRRNAVARAALADDVACGACRLRHAYTEALRYVCDRKIPPKKYLLAAMIISAAIIPFN